ncbi:MAG: N-acetyl-gamma-glutamyl-phosphate reductase, partial [Acidimicrobiales bacterium]
MASQAELTVGIVGASGYTGAELLRLIAGHPNMTLAAATGDSMAGTRIADLYPSLALAYGDRTFDAYDPAAVAGVDIAFCGLPHGVSMGVVPDLLGRVGRVIDLGSDFRLKDPGLYPQWYGADHTSPELLDRAVYGLPELYRNEIASAELIAATGCNAATTTLTLAPLLTAGLIEPDGIVVNLITGVSGAGRPPKPNTTFCTVDENVSAYGLLTHRHTPEIEQSIGLAAGGAASVLFTPHLAPMSRGILSTSYATPIGSPTTDEVLDTLAKTYADHPFVVVRDDPPGTKDTLGSNAAHVTARVDPRTGHAVVICAIDNLGKGASGQALQCANMLLDYPET